MDNQVTVLLTTCDKQSDAWDPFFYFWKTYWPDCQYLFIINTEEKTYTSSDFSVKSIQGGKGLPWSKRLKNCLKHIETEYVLLCLEDYFLQAPVDVDIFNAALKTMEETPDLGVIQFAIDIRTKYDQDVRINQYFAPVPKQKKDKFNGRIYCVLSLYRTRYLKKLLSSSESPWEFEIFGSLRSQYYREKVYRETEDHPRCFQYYIEPVYGYAISRGKWLPKNKELFAAHGLKINFDDLGIMTDEEYRLYVDRLTKKTQAPKPHHTLKQKLQMPFVQPAEFFRLIKHTIKKHGFPFLP